MDNLESIRPAEGGFPYDTHESLALDKTLTVGRLALLEERDGSAEQAAKFWYAAVAYAHEARWRDTSAANIRNTIQRLDGPRPTDALKRR